MKITELQFTGVKGKDGAYNLKPITAVVGDNATCKTSLLTAARILLTAKNPLAHKAPIKVIGTLDSGATLVREWKLNKGVAKTAHELPVGWPDTPVVLLDPLDYLDRSERERVKYVSSLVSAGESSGQWIEAKVRGLTFDNLSREIVMEHETQCESVGRSLTLKAGDKTVQEIVESLVAEYATKESTAKAVVERLKGFGAAQVQLQSSDIQTATRNVDSELAEASKRYGEASARLAALLRAEKDSKASVEYQARLRGEASRLTDKSAEIAQLEQELEKEQARVNGYLSRVPDLAAQLNKLSADRNKLTYEHETQTRVIQRAEDEIKSILARICPCCANSGEACQANSRAVERERVKISDAQKILDSNKGNQEAVNATINRLSDAQKIAFGEDDVIRQCNQVMTSKWSALGLLRAQQSAFLKVNEQLKAVGVAVPPSQSDLQEARVQVESDAKTLENLQTMQKRHAAAQQEESRKRQSLKELTDAEAVLEVTKAVRRALLEAQGEMVSRLFGSLLEVINRVAVGLIATPVEYHEGEIGRRSADGNWISHRDFSGFEKAVVYTGIAAALAKDAPVKLVLIDDLIISRHNKHRLLTRVMELIKDGVIDQLLITDCHDEDYAEFVNHHSDMFGVVNV